MSSERDGGPDSVVPDSAMGTGSEEGTPGRGREDLPLDPDEQRLLAELKRSGPDAVAPVEDTPEAAAAVADDAPLPPTDQGR